MIAATMPQLRGCNMAGANFPYTSLPPASGTNYLYPSTQDIDYASAKGVNFFRLLVSWEALQSSLNAALGSGGAAYATYLAQLKAFVAYATGKGVYVMVEPHGGVDSDFAGYMGNAVGTSAVPNSAFANFWGQMAALFADNELVIFGLSNEPCAASEGGPAGGGGVAAWFASCNAAIAAIRSNGFEGLIMVPGQQFTAASQWLSNWYDTASPQVSNMTGVTAISDPANNWCISVHMYVNQDQSGNSNDVGPTTTIASGSNGLSLPQSTIHVSSTNEWVNNFGWGSGYVWVTTASGLELVSFTGTTSTSFTGCSGGAGKMSTGGAVTGAPGVCSFLLQPLITACRMAGIRLHLSEFGVEASTANASAACADLLHLLNSNQDVCLGMSWYPDGPPSWYGGSEPFTLCPSQGSGTDTYATDSPQMALAVTFWQGAAQAHAQAAHAEDQTAIAALQPKSGPTAGRPASPVNGQMYLDTTLGVPVWALSGTTTGWVNANGVSV